MDKKVLWVSNVMAKEIITVTRGTTLSSLLKKFHKFHTFPLIPVVEKDGRLVGTISFKEIVEIFRTKGLELIKGIPFLDKDELDIFDLDINEDEGLLFVAEDLMKTKPLFLEEETTLEDAYKTMKINSVDVMPVVDKEGRITGMLGIFDIFVSIFKQKGLF